MNELKKLDALFYFSIGVLTGILLLGIFLHFLLI